MVCALKVTIAPTAKCTPALQENTARAKDIPMPINVNLAQRVIFAQRVLV
jgi:hypothetical protein